MHSMPYRILRGITTGMERRRALFLCSVIVRAPGTKRQPGNAQVEDDEAYMAGVANETILPGLGPFGIAQKQRVPVTQQHNGRRPRLSKADEAGLKLCQFCDRKKRLQRFPLRLIMTCKGHAERKLGAHCKKCTIRSAHLRSNGYMRPHAQDIIRCYHKVRLFISIPALQPAVPW